MKEYIIVNHFKFLSFQEEVDEFLADGFVLIGGVSAAFDHREGRMYYFQAMAK